MVLCAQMVEEVKPDPLWLEPLPPPNQRLSKIQPEHGDILIVWESLSEVLPAFSSHALSPSQCATVVMVPALNRAAKLRSPPTHVRSIALRRNSRFGLQAVGLIPACLPTSVHHCDGHSRLAESCAKR